MLSNPFSLRTEYNHIRLFMMLYCTALGIQMLLNFRAQLRFFATQPSDVRATRILGKVPLPKLSVQAFTVVGLCLCVSLFLASSGFQPRFFLSLSLIGYFLYFGQIRNLAYIRRKTNILPFVLLILVVSPALSDALNHATPIWPIFLIKGVTASVYFSSGYQKLRNTGWRWANGKPLQVYLLDHYLWGDMKVALILAERLWLCRLLSIITLSFELTFWMILLFPGLTYLYVVVGIGFHIMTELAMRIQYLKYFGLVYLVFTTDSFFWLFKYIGWI
jgi:hypothetical protein